MEGHDSAFYHNLQVEAGTADVWYMLSVKVLVPAVCENLQVEFAEEVAG